VLHFVQTSLTVGETLQKVLTERLIRVHPLLLLCPMMVIASLHSGDTAICVPGARALRGSFPSSPTGTESRQSVA
jgi:hypothetical protein